MKSVNYEKIQHDTDYHVSSDNMKFGQKYKIFAEHIKFEKKN